MTGTDKMLRVQTDRPCRRRARYAQVRARRDGREVILNVTQLLVGDVLLLEAGDVIPADAVLVDSCATGQLYVDESHMTGEPDDVRKSSAETPVLLSGSKVLEGRCAALCVAVGVNSQMGVITSLVRQQDEVGGRGDDDESSADASSSFDGDGIRTPATAIAPRQGCCVNVKNNI